MYANKNCINYITEVRMVTLLRQVRSFCFCHDFYLFSYWPASTANKTPGSAQHLESMFVFVFPAAIPRLVSLINIVSPHLPY